ncbi:MAG TPA: hypothetical protein VM121_11390, partial [Acidimicrobiales bacterium]|nr:hypothetical protein [Acidimicrobiales bacterium]
SSLSVAGRGPAIATNPEAVARPGRDVAYEWMAGSDEPEATHEFHSHGDTRQQSDHGLFGALVVEPPGSEWIDPLTGKAADTGWTAMIRPKEGPAFREYVLDYHEIGDESYQLLDSKGQFIPLVDPLTHAYRPDGRAINYRSEPFMDRLLLQQQKFGSFDESLEYSSYGFGDPATPIMRSYLGDPVTQRVVHGGGEVFHVHHAHGGGIRWRRQPGVEPVPFAVGLDKHPQLRPKVSERTDAQTIGPSETFDIVDECGSGGCQQSVGDFMFHCHVTEHYFAGMWGVWRVYNTRQDGAASTDTLPPLELLPDRGGGVRPAVESPSLIGQEVGAYGATTRIGSAEDLHRWVEAQLPPPGVPKGYDASVFDWQRDGERYLGEPETTDSWANYTPRAPGTRRAILFDPATGKPAYPMLQPHLAKRPPFAPDHGPAPYLDPFQSGPDPPAPGENGSASTCPTGTRPKRFDINVINVPVPLSAKDNIVDPNGQLYVLRSDVDAARADPAKRVPLAIRANASEDCIDTFFRSELNDDEESPLSKVSVHVHLMQFDVQGSDGVNTGFNYEQTVRPFRLAGVPVGAPSVAGATSVTVADASSFQAGAVVGVGMDRDQELDVRRITSVVGNVLTFDGPLPHAHEPGEIVSAEFVRYRWYPDTQFGTAFFHDHVNVITSGRHGLYGAVISEPPGSSYHDPQTGAEVRSGAIADVRTGAPVSTDVVGSFRELVMPIQDDNPLTHVGGSTGSSLALRVAPLDSRNKGDPSMLFSSPVNGDPETPLLQAFVGDPVIIRALVGASNDVHSFHVDGHWFRVEPWSSRSPPTSNVDIGISERYDLVLPRAGGPQARAGDYLYYNGRTLKLREGSWGIMRVLDGASDAPGAQIQRLPGHESPPAPASGSVCPPGAPLKEFSVRAVDVALPMLRSTKGKAYVLEADAPAVTSGRRAPEPFVLHVGVGDCIKVKLTNDTSGGPVSIHSDMLSFDPADSGGVAAGNNPPQAVAKGQSRTSTFFASAEVGETTALLRDWGDVTKNPGLGLYGAIVVGPAGATYSDPVTGTDVSMLSRPAVDVHPRSGSAYRDFSLFFQDEDATIGTHRMPYNTVVEGPVGLNYAAAPLRDRLDATPDTGLVHQSNSRHGDPPTLVLSAYPDDPVRVHVLAPWSEQAQVFSIEGHEWPQEPGTPATPLRSSVTLGGLDALTLSLQGGAGPAGDYVYGNHREPYREAGMWGLLRVRAGCDPAVLRPLSGACGPGGGAGDVIGTSVVVGAGLAIVAALLLATRRARRRR